MRAFKANINLSRIRNDFQEKFEEELLTVFHRDFLYELISKIGVDPEHPDLEHRFSSYYLGVDLSIIVNKDSGIIYKEINIRPGFLELQKLKKSYSDMEKVIDLGFIQFVAENSKLGKLDSKGLRDIIEINFLKENLRSGLPESYVRVDKKTQNIEIEIISRFANLGSKRTLIGVTLEKGPEITEYFRDAQNGSYSLRKRINHSNVISILDAKRSA